MASRQETIPAPGNSTNFIKALKAKLGEQGLETIHAYDAQKAVPDRVSKVLDASPSDLSIALNKYICATQASVPPSHPTSEDPVSIQAGWGGKIPRWKTGETVNFAAYAGGYPTRDHALFAAYKLNDAANRWNDLRLGGGVNFQWVSRLEDAAFVLAYGGDGGSTIARAFEPNTNDLNTLFVYQKAFEPGIINSLYNVFLHELGHVLGLRHEFAPEKEADDPSIQIGPRNPDSVMSYKFPPQIQPSDETSTQIFYELPEGFYQGLQVVHVIPNN